MTRSDPDLNLLIALDALLHEQSVAGAARRLRLSPSAMSRTLTRLREATGDPLLVRAGREMVPSPRAARAMERVAALLAEARVLLGPDALPDPASLSGTVSLRVSDGFVEAFGPSLVTRLQHTAPGLRLRFIARHDRSSDALREGGLDLDTGVIGEEASPEIRSRGLYRTRLVGVVREGHPLLDAPVDIAAFLGRAHVAVRAHVPQVERRLGPVDVALQEASPGSRRSVVAEVASFSAAVALVRGTDLVATVPDRGTAGLRDGVCPFQLPFPMAPVTVSLMWHPRDDADPVHRWVRDFVKDVCDSVIGE